MHYATHHQTSVHSNEVPPIQTGSDILDPGGPWGRPELGRMKLLNTEVVPQHSGAGAGNAVKDLVAGTDGCHLCHLCGDVQVIHKQRANALAEEGDEEARACHEQGP